MLLEFTVGNFRSFKEKVTLSMLASSITGNEEDNIFEVRKNIKLLKSAVIYGANASGKSNLLNAMKFMKTFVINSSKESQKGEPIEVENYRLSTETENEPSFFEIIFLLNDFKYRYGFEVDTGKVHSEWLFSANLKNKSVKETFLYTRESNKIDINPRQFKEGLFVKENINATVRDNSLFLSLIAQLKDDTISSNIIMWFQKNFNTVNQRVQPGYSIKKLKDEKCKIKMITLMKLVGLGFDDICTEEYELDMNEIGKKLKAKIPFIFNKKEERFTVTELTTEHKKYDENNKFISIENFNFASNESEGSIKFFEFSAPIIDTLENSKVLIVDELESSMHPILTKFIVNLFNSCITNPKNAQLIFTTHDTTLLKKENFRRDQIWFTEKDRFGATDLYSLAEFKTNENARKDTSFDKNYILGKYGAIPYLGDPSELFGAENE